jgi:hypothetical protein
MTTMRDRLAADLHDTGLQCVTDDAQAADMIYHRASADRLIAKGWTKGSPNDDKVWLTEERLARALSRATPYVIYDGQEFAAAIIRALREEP